MVQLALAPELVNPPSYVFIAVHYDYDERAESIAVFASESQARRYAEKEFKISHSAEIGRSLVYFLEEGGSVEIIESAVQ
ncbi:hypothetical protein UFOVP903_32 [uncultured Caudovirales phage]|uniref:Uncharacterized protein n=1 Tax=uncultured Caudovirales phage TaxID=2100421 RepID=A0A6J5PQS5_9CAUD|nr:hypothetical protein UFOVP903_32 [uncultured Caudovirales phage]CAB4197403.1 hypothetical protein UFOVP1318_14 [uncultured Caudovirales phage]CAB4210616.1 hypothetical protein UFOVP1430_30 [uncultured Caudovirales phage]